MKYTLASFVVSMLVSAQAFAGASLVNLDCKSADGKIGLAGDVPGDFLEFELTSTVKGTPFPTLNLYQRTNQKTGDTERNGRVTVIEDLKNGVYTLEATDLEENAMILMRVYALPKTVKYKQKGSAWDASFSGKLVISSENGSDAAEVLCKLHYSI